MHILTFLALIIGGIGIWWWRYRMLSQAGEEIIDSIGRMRGAMKRRSFLNKANNSVLHTIKDPAIAAGVLFFSLAEEKQAGAMKAKTLIKELLTRIVPEKDVEEVIIFAEWAAQSTPSPRDVTRKFIPLWKSTLTADQQFELISMANDVIQNNTPETETQKAALISLKQAFLN